VIHVAEARLVCQLGLKHARIHYDTNFHDEFEHFIT